MRKSVPHQGSTVWKRQLSWKRRRTIQQIAVESLKIYDWSVGGSNRSTCVNFLCLDPVLTNIPNVSAPSVEHLDFLDHALVLSGIVINDYNNKLSSKLKSKRLWRASTLANPVDLETAMDHQMQNLASSGMNNMWFSGMAK